MSGSVGLVVGLSLSDRNMRRLLDAIVSLPNHPAHFALLRRPRWNRASNQELDQINSNALQYKEQFEKSGVKGAGEKGPGEKRERWRDEIRSIIQEVERLDAEQQTYVLNQLGVQPIWYDEHSDIPTILSQILKPGNKRRA